MGKKRSVQTVTLVEVRDAVKKHIKENLEMSIHEFANSEKPKEMGITVKPQSIEMAFANGSKSLNFKLLKSLYEGFNLGKLKRKQTLVKTTTFLKLG